MPPPRYQDSPLASFTAWTPLVRGEDTLWCFQGPARRCDQAALEWTRAALLPMVQASLPGYGDSFTPARCLLEADEGALLMDAHGQWRGFVALRRACVEGVEALYLVLAVLDPAQQRRGWLERALRHALAQRPAAVLAATTNVPGLWHLWRRLAQPQARIWPWSGESAPPQVRTWGRALLAQVLQRPVEEVPLDEKLVRRAYRSRDLQAVPIEAWLEQVRGAAARRGQGELVQLCALLGEELALRPGDAALLLAELAPSALAPTAP